jgi:uncharacterized protein (TIGR00288 family)
VDGRKLAVNGDRIKHLLVLGLAGFGLGSGLGWLVQRDWQKAWMTGLAALPVVYVGAVLTRPTPYSGSTEPSLNRFLPPAQGQTSRIAIFWDHENVRSPSNPAAISLGKAIETFALQRGHLCQKAVYSNWRNESNSVLQSLSSLGFDTIQVSMGKQNSVDIKLTVDCLTTAYQNPDITHFILVTSDKDFIPLVHALKAIQRKVILIGRTKSTGIHLPDSADEYVPLDAVMALVNTDRTAEEDSRLHHTRSASTPEKKTEPALDKSTPTMTFEEGVECLLDVLTDSQKKGKQVNLSQLNELMRDHPGFSYQKSSSIYRADGTPFGQFRKFIKAVEATGKIRIHQIDHSDYVLLPEQDDSVAVAPPTTPETLTVEHWEIILDQLELAFQEIAPDDSRYGRFVILLAYVRQAKRDGRLNLTNNLIQKALNQLVEVGLLVTQPDNRLIPADSWSEKRTQFMHQQG